MTLSTVTVDPLALTLDQLAAGARHDRSLRGDLAIDVAEPIRPFADRAPIAWTDWFERDEDERRTLTCVVSLRDGSGATLEPAYGARRHARPIVTDFDPVEWEKHPLNRGPRAA